MELSVLYKSCNAYWKSTCAQEHVHYDSIKLFIDMLKDKDRVRLIMISLLSSLHPTFQQPYGQVSQVKIYL